MASVLTDGAGNVLTDGSGNVLTDELPGGGNGGNGGNGGDDGGGSMPPLQTCPSSGSIWMDMLDSIYASPICGPAQLILDDTSGTTVDITAKDDTRGYSVAGMAGKFGVALETIKPVAFIRACEMSANGVARADLRGALIKLHAGEGNEKIWNIESHQLKPTPDGEMAGEVMLILTEIPS